MRPEEPGHPLHPDSRAGGYQGDLHAELVGHGYVEGLVGQLQGHLRLVELLGYHGKIVPHLLELSDDLLQ